MRRLASALAVGSCAAALALSGCGEDEASSPLGEALGYLPAKAPFAVAIDTDLNGGQYKSVKRIVGKFPFGDQVQQGLEQQLEQDSNIDFDKDVRPILGNPFVVGVTEPRSITNGSSSGDGEGEFVRVIKARDKGKLEALLKKDKAKEQGEKSGAKLYKDDDGDTFAVKDDVLIVANDRRRLERALAQREKDDRLGEEAFDKGLDGLPENALLRVYADVRALVKSDPDGRDSEKIRWAGALRTLGLTAAASDNGLAIDFNLKTEGELSDTDLPIAPGEGAPGIVQRSGEIGVGLRNLAQVVVFAETAAQAVNPSGYGDYAAAKRQLEGQLGVTIDKDLIEQLKGDTALSAAVDGKFGWRSELEDPAGFERTLEKVAGAAPRLAAGTGNRGVRVEKPRGRDGLYELRRSGEDTAYFGVMDEVFVIANDPALARELASASPSQVPGAKGALVLNADAEKVANQALTRLGPSLGFGGALGGALFTGPLGELTGSVSSAKDGMRGSLKLEIE